MSRPIINAKEVPEYQYNYLAEGLTNAITEFWKNPPQWAIERKAELIRRREENEAHNKGV